MLCRHSSLSHVSVGLFTASLVLALGGSVSAQVTEHKLTASDGAEGDYFGSRVSLSGDRAIIGAALNDVGCEDNGRCENRGSVYVFERQQDSSWLEVAILTASDGVAFDLFGFGVSLSEEGRALIGASRDDDLGTDSGSAYVFERQEDASWVEVTKLTASDGAALNWFGISTSISVDRALVGAPGGLAGSGYGSAYIFERQEDGSWLEVATLTASDGAASDRFGISVSLSADLAIVGAHLDDDLGIDSGSAYVFERQEDSSWLEVAKLTASDGATHDSFGRSVSHSNNRALIGTPDDTHGLDTESGSAYIFEQQEDGSWLEVAKLTASDGGRFDHFGRDVSLVEDMVLVGAFIHYEMGSESGSAYVFVRREDGSWLEAGEIYSSDGADLDLFGASVSLSEDRALVGAYHNDAMGMDTGAAYVYDDLSSLPTSREQSSDVPRGIQLSAPYPNPFYSSAAVPFEVPEAAHVRLTLVDIFGREVAILLDRQVAAGRHEAVLDGGRLASGVYLVRLEAEGVIHATQKVLLLR